MSDAESSDGQDAVEGSAADASAADPAPATEGSGGQPGPPPAPPSPAAPAEAAGGPSDVADAARDVPFEHRHPDALRLELAVGGAVAGGVGVTGLLLAALLVFVAGLPGWLLGPAIALPLLLIFPLVVVPRWRHRHYRYRVDRRGLEIRKGIWWRSHRLIPHTRLQHTDIAQGPLERQFGLASLVVHTAGTHEARTTVSGLAVDRARRLRDLLTAEAATGGGGDDGV